MSERENLNKVLAHIILVILYNVSSNKVIFKIKIKVFHYSYVNNEFSKSIKRRMYFYLNKKRKLN